MKRAIAILILIFPIAVGCQEQFNSASPPQETAVGPPAFVQSTTTSTDSDALTQTVIKMAIENAQRAFYQPLVTAFEEEHPEIDVKLLAIEDVASNSDDYWKQVAESADLFTYSTSHQAGEAYLLNLDPLIENDPFFEKDDFAPGLLPSDGESIYAIPTSAVYRLIYFDKSAFDEAGLPYPKPGWSLDEFLAAAQLLTAREGDETVRWGYMPLDVRYEPLLSTQLTAPLIVNGQPRWEAADVITAVQQFSELFTQYQISPWLPTYRDLATGRLEQLQLMGNGTSAMWQRGHTFWSQYPDAGVVTAPVSEAGYAADPLLTGFAISRGTQQPEAAWQLLTFLSRQSPIVMDDSLPVPARLSVAEVTNFWERIPPQLAPALRFAVENNKAARFSVKTIGIVDVLAAVIEDDLSVETAVANAQTTSVEQSGTPQETSEPIMVATDEPETPQITIRFATTWNEYDAIRELAKAYQEENKGIAINVERIDTEQPINEDPILAQADCFVYMADQVEQYEQPLLALTPLIELDSTIDVSDFYPGAIVKLTSNGDLFALPAWVRMRYIEYNRTLFEEAGITEPNADWTLAQFLQSAQALTDEEKGQVGFVDWERRVLIDGMTQFTPHPIDPEQQQFDFAATEEMMQWYVDLVTLYRVQPPMPGLFLDVEEVFDRYDLFYQLVTQEKAAMWIGDVNDRGLTNWVNAQESQIGVVPIPRGPSGRNIDFGQGLAAYYIKADTDLRQPCWEWIKFLTEQPLISPYLPGRITTAESAKFMEYVGAERVTVYLSSAVHSTEETVPSLNGWYNPALLWLSIIYELAVKENQPIQPALLEAQELFNTYRACLIENNGFSVEPIWQACATATDARLKARYGSQN